MNKFENDKYEIEFVDTSIEITDKENNLTCELNFDLGTVSINSYGKIQGLKNIIYLEFPTVVKK